MTMRLCQWCLNPYDERLPRSAGELEKLRQVLSMTGPAATTDIAICDSCFSSAVYSAMERNNESSLDIGKSNSGPPNLLLQKLG